MKVEEAQMLLSEFGKAFERITGKPACVEAWHLDNFKGTLDVRFLVDRYKPPAPAVVPHPSLTVSPGSLKRYQAFGPPRCTCDIFTNGCTCGAWEAERKARGEQP